MSHNAIVVILWSLLGVSLLLTVWGVARQSARALFVAAALAAAFGIAAIFSIGIFILGFAAGQLVIGLAIRRAGARQ